MLSLLGTAAALLLAGWATALEGATTHEGAFLLRVVVVGACVVLWPRNHAPVSPFLLVPPALALVVTTWGLIGAPNPGLAQQRLLSVLLVVCLYLCLWTRSHDVTGKALIFAGVIALAHAGWAVGQVLTHVGAHFLVRGHGGFFNPNDLAAFLAPLGILALSHALAPDGQARRRRALWAIALLLGLGIVATFSRSGFLGALAGVLILVMARSSKLTLLVGATTAALLLLTPSLASRFLGSKDAHAYDRIHIWRASVELALENPLGVGLNNFEVAMRQRGVPLPGLVRYPKVAAQAHSEVLHAWVELGLPGLMATLLPPLMLAWIILGRGRRGAREPPHDDGPTESRADMLAVWTAIAVPALLSSSLHVPPVAFLVAIWAARVSRTAQLDRSAAIPGGGAARAVVGLLGVLVLLAALPGVVAQHASKRAATLRERKDLKGALEAATVAEAAAPWSLGHAMLAASLRYLHGEPPLAVVEALLTLAERFPDRPEPLQRAAWVLEQQAATLGHTRERWLFIAKLRRKIAACTPFDALAWLDLGRAHQKAEDHQEAEAAWTRAVAIEPLCAEALARLAVARTTEQDKAQAARLAATAWRAHAHSSEQRARAARILSLSLPAQDMLRRSGLGPP